MTWTIQGIKPKDIRSPSWPRTSDLTVNSRALYRLSYRRPKHAVRDFPTCIYPAKSSIALLRTTAMKALAQVIVPSSTELPFYLPNTAA